MMAALNPETLLFIRFWWCLWGFRAFLAHLGRFKSELTLVVAIILTILFICFKLRLLKDAQHQDRQTRQELPVVALQVRCGIMFLERDR